MQKLIENFDLDVTMKALQRLLDKAEKYSLGDALPGLMHEMNNPLNAILMNAELGKLCLQKGDHERLEKVLSVIVSEVGQLSHMTTEVYQFVRRAGAAPSEQGKVSAIVGDVLRLSASQLRNSQLDVQVDSPDDEPIIPVNRFALRIALGNVISAAVMEHCNRLAFSIGVNGHHVDTVITADDAFISWMVSLYHSATQLMIDESTAASLPIEPDALKMVMLLHTINGHDGRLIAQPSQQRFVIRLPKA